MTAKEYLNQGYLLDKQIKSKQTQIEILNQSIIKITANISGSVITGGKPCDFTDTIARIVDLKQELILEIKKSVALKKEIWDLIRQIEQPYALLLESRYINLLKWEKICNELNYSWRQTHRIHGKALLQLEKRLNA